jgi:hypothetical protein
MENFVLIMSTLPIYLRVATQHRTEYLLSRRIELAPEQFQIRSGAFLELENDCKAVMTLKIMSHFPKIKVPQSQKKGLYGTIV